MLTLLIVFTDPSYASSWPPLLFLADLYTQSLLTMGDDEFFSSASTTASTAPRNPLTLDELTAFSRKLLNIAFTLYWREDQTNVQEGGVPGVNLKWEGVYRPFMRGSEFVCRLFDSEALLTDITQFS